MEIIVPELGESIVEATVAKWLKQEGEAVSLGEAVVELQTDKVDLEVGAKTAGVLAKIDRAEGEDVKVGDVLGRIEASPAAPPSPAPHQEATPPSAAPPERKESPEKITPVARRIAEDKGLDLRGLTGTGPGERITKNDLAALVAAPAPKPESPASTPTPAPAVTSSNGERPERREKMTRRRRTIAQRLIEAQQTAALLTTFNDVDMSAVMEIRSRRKTTFEQRHGVRLGFMSFFVKAAIGALRQFPQLNAEIQGEEIVFKDYYDIGVAIGSPEGLVVPVIRNADRLSFAQIETAIVDFSQKVANGKLGLEDLRGGTFSITNGGVFGSLLSTPILNPPQVAILGLHRIEDRPVALNGQVVIRPMMYLALTYDHRIVDGREAVQFLVRIKELIQDPETLLLEG